MRNITASTWTNKKTEDIDFQGFITDSEIKLIGDGAFSLFGGFHHSNLPLRQGSPTSKGLMSLGLAFDASRIVPTTFENRPANTSVRYFVRSKP